MSLVNSDHFSSPAGYPSIGQKVRRVRENHIEYPIGMLVQDQVHNLHAICMVEPNTDLVISEHTFIRGIRRSIHDHEWE